MKLPKAYEHRKTLLLKPEEKRDDHIPALARLRCFPRVTLPQEGFITNRLPRRLKNGVIPPLGVQRTTLWCDRSNLFLLDRLRKFLARALGSSKARSQDQLEPRGTYLWRTRVLGKL